MEVRAAVALDVVWIGLTVVAVLAFLASVASLVQGIRLRGGVRRGMRLALGAFLPSVALILPVRGLDEGFDENVRALLSQAYPRYRLLVVADDSTDPASARIETIARDFPIVPVTQILADANPLGGKVNALRSALGHLVPEDEVVVFADSDIRPARDWLRQLVQPLADSTVGVATGFRWYVPPRPTFWSLVRAEWNAVSANVLFDPRRSFAWGGSCAVPADRLDELRLGDRSRRRPCGGEPSSPVPRPWPRRGRSPRGDLPPRRWRSPGSWPRAFCGPETRPRSVGEATRMM